MKEITRIHIARTAYDIELSAKQALEKYLRSLEAYSNDKEVLEDVEIRMTEILAERGVKPGGVIGDGDVTALKEQLGEAAEFADGEVTPEIVAADQEVSRKLYRDLDRRIIGGVMSGIAAYFKINPTWVRLVFIIVALASFGTALFVYAVLWIAIPPARTAADKLQMNGRPVTVNSIRELTENEATRPSTNNAETRRVLTFLLGLACVVGALVAAGITVFGALAMPLSGRFELMEVMTHSPALLAAFILALTSGLLLVAMFTLGAYASFVQKLSRRVMVTIGLVVVLGLASFGTAVGLTRLGTLQLHDAVQANTKTKAVSVPGGLASVNSLDAETNGVTVRYQVTNEAPHATIQALYADKTTAPKVTMTIDGKTLHVKAEQTADNCNAMWGCISEPIVTIYGPALEHVTGNGNETVTYQANKQASLTVEANAESSVSLTGQVDALSATLLRGSQLDAATASVMKVDLDITNASVIELGAVNELSLSTREACASDDKTTIEADDVTGGHIMFNGERVPVGDRETTCSELTITRLDSAD